MSKTPRLTGRQLIATLARAGETIGPGLLHKILRDCEISIEQLESYL